MLLLVAKVIPMLLAFFHFVNILLAYFNISCIFINYLAGVSIFTITFLYIVSYALRFCEYHRTFIHYCVITNILNIYDEYIGIPIDNQNYFILLMTISAIMLFLILYFKLNKI